MTEEQAVGRLARVERRLRITQFLFAGLLCAQLVWIASISNRRWSVGPPMDEDRVQSLVSAIYYTEHPRPPGHDDDPIVLTHGYGYLEWRRTFFEHYRKNVRDLADE